MDSVLIHHSPFLNILERFEKRLMMITKAYHDRSRDYEYSISLHRFGLEFCFSEGCEKFSCSEVVGYHLRPTQHLSWC